MGRVYWQYKLDQTYLYQDSRFLLKFLAKQLWKIGLLNEYKWMDSLYFYQEDLGPLKELYTDEVMEFSIRHITKDNGLIEVHQYPIYFHIPDTNVYFTRTLHHLDDSSQRFCRLNDEKICFIIGAYYYKCKLFDFIYRYNCEKKRQLVLNYFDTLQKQKNKEDQSIENIIKGKKEVKKKTLKNRLIGIFGYFLPEQSHKRKDERMKRSSKKYQHQREEQMDRFFRDFKGME